MTAESIQKLRALEEERKEAQTQLFVKFMNSLMTVKDYERRSYYIDMKFAREQALIILEAIMQTEQANLRLTGG